MVTLLTLAVAQHVQVVQLLGSMREVSVFPFIISMTVRLALKEASLNSATKSLLPWKFALI